MSNKNYRSRMYEIVSLIKILCVNISVQPVLFVFLTTIFFDYLLSQFSKHKNYLIKYPQTTYLQKISLIHYKLLYIIYNLTYLIFFRYFIFHFNIIYYYLLFIIVYFQIYKEKKIQFQFYRNKKILIFVKLFYFLCRSK